MLEAALPAAEVDSSCPSASPSAAADDVTGGRHTSRNWPRSAGASAVSSFWRLVVSKSRLRSYLWALGGFSMLDSMGKGHRVITARFGGAPWYGLSVPFEQFRYAYCECVGWTGAMCTRRCRSQSRAAAFAGRSSASRHLA